jgi:hypothetical protein
VWDAERLALADQDRDVQGGSVTTESL